VLRARRFGGTAVRERAAREARARGRLLGHPERCRTANEGTVKSRSCVHQRQCLTSRRDSGGASGHVHPQSDPMGAAIDGEWVVKRCTTQRKAGRAIQKGRWKMTSATTPCPRQRAPRCARRRPGRRRAARRARKRARPRAWRCHSRTWPSLRANEIFSVRRRPQAKDKEQVGTHGGLRHCARARRRPSAT
jgi:hypothetical protein